ncbi:MAG: cell division protein SepF [Actinomycetes bacterium]
MAGAMRKMAVYLGLVEDEADRYDTYEDYEVADVRSEEASRDVQSAHDGHRGGSVTAMPDRGRLRESPSEPMDAHRIVTLHPRTYNEARTIGEHFREATPVIMNLTDMGDPDAKRLVDFSAGLVFGLRGSIERVTNKVFLLSPANVEVTAEDKARIAEGGFFNQS